MNTFYYNTGVVPSKVSNFPYDYHKSVGNVIRGTLLIPFDCDAPKDAEVMFFASDPNLREASLPNVQVFEIHNTNIVSKYAYFRIKT